MKNKVLNTIKKHSLFEKDMHIVIGLSGGPDSVCLFDILFSMAEEMKWILHPVHVNHLFRPGEAEEDQAYVEKLCKDRGLKCHTFIYDCNNIAMETGKTSEEVGRLVRYQAFSHTAEEITNGGVSKDKVAIAVAHNAEDQCETILFRIMRGSGVDGLAGIPYKRFDEKGFRIVRPLLDIGRREIEEYCEIKKLNPRFDRTNKENIYTRNKIRNLLVPYIEENFNKGIVETINRLGKIAAADKDYMYAQAGKEYAGVAKKSENSHGATVVKIPVDALKSLHEAIRMRIYALALGDVNLKENITFSQLKEIDTVVFGSNPSAVVNLTEGFIATREYDLIAFSDNKVRVTEEEEWVMREMSYPQYIQYAKEAGFHRAFSGVELETLRIRGREPGDRINLGGFTKKLQDFLVDEKVPKIYRDEIKVLARGKEILWILPSEYFSKENLQKRGRLSKANNVDKDKKSVIVLEKAIKM